MLWYFLASESEDGSITARPDPVSRGRRSLPSCLGGGDLDGDVYNLVLDVSDQLIRGTRAASVIVFHIERSLSIDCRGSGCLHPPPGQSNPTILHDRGRSRVELLLAPR